MASGPSQGRESSRYEMGQTTRSEWESDMRAHRELLRNVIEEHREGRDGKVGWSEMLEELQLEEEPVYPPISALGSSNPPAAVQGDSGWVYHSTSLGCLKPHHLPRRIAIATVEAPFFDPLILTTILCNCTTMAWASPLDPPGTWKQDLLAVRALSPVVSPTHFLPGPRPAPRERGSRCGVPARATAAAKKADAPPSHTPRRPAAPRRLAACSPPAASPSPRPRLPRAARPRRPRVAATLAR